MGETCVKCGEDHCHPDREYRICLDCLIKVLIEEGAINLPVNYTAKWQDDNARCTSCKEIKGRENLDGGGLCNDCFKKWLEAEPAVEEEGGIRNGKETTNKAEEEA